MPKPVTRISELIQGTIIRSKLDGRSYTVTGNYGDRATAVRSVDVSNPIEWEIIDRTGA